jgi:carbonic anhydrase/acetyltransferase-like protein (isoleucine patch superfamily)
VGHVSIGDRVIIGHGAVLNCRRVGDQVLIGMNATILHDVEIGNNCIIGAGSLVSQGMKIPDDSFVVGVPAKVKGKVTPEQLWWINEGYKQYLELVKEYKKENL